MFMFTLTIEELDLGRIEVIGSDLVRGLTIM